jgi:YHS domain-containing protein
MGFLSDILEFVFLVLFLKAMYQNLGSLFSSSRRRVGAPPVRPPAPPTVAAHRGEMARDPVCGIFVSTELSHRLKRNSETLHFCSPECMEKYQKDVEHVAS